MSEQIQVPGIVVPNWAKNRGYGDPSLTIKFQDPKNGRVFWESNPGFQTWVCICPYDEILGGGARGGGKSGVLAPWFAMGDLSLPEDDPARYSFLNDPDFRGLILREQYQDLKEFVDQAMDFFRHFGCKPVDDPVIFQFKSGARIYTNHLNNEEAYNKYRGWNITKIGIEELAQVPKLSQYIALMGSLRSVARVRRGKHYPKLRTQIYCTTNPDGPGSCVPYGEVMTPSGWRDIKTMRVGDPVFTIKPDGEIVVSHVEQVHKGPRSGPMCYVNMRGFHMACTPNHQVAKIAGVRMGRNTRDKEHPLFGLVEFQKLPGQAQVLRSGWWKGEDLPEFHAPICETPRRLAQPKSLSANLFCELLGWFLSEGSIHPWSKAFSISQKKPDGRAALKILLEDECGFRFHWSRDGATIYAPDWWMYFRQFGKCHEKFIPEWVKAGTPENLTHLFNALMDGDGHWETREQSGTYYTISKQLADDVCEVALKIGYQVYVSRRVRHHSDRITYQINVKRTKLGGVEFQTGNHVYDVVSTVKKQPAVSIRHSNKPVYCIGVPETHTFFIRQHGAVWVSGNSWIRNRWVEVPGPNGPIPWNTPMRDKVTGLTRIFIPARLKDNPYLADDRRYLGMLLSQDTVKQAQWIEGDWNAGSGVFFRDYRPNGPMRDEPEWARHLIDPVELKPWWFRWGGGDWGYDHPAAFHKACYNPQDKRIYIYDELTVRQVGSYELGTMLARWWMPELQNLPDHQVTVSISPDAFAKRDETRTQAEQMAAGIQEILGPTGAILLRYNDEERMLSVKDPKAAAAMFEWRKKQAKGGMAIALKPAYRNRVANASYLRDLLRWRPLNLEAEPDMQYAKTLFEHRGMQAYEDYLASFRDRKPEVLPKLLITKKCRELDRCLRTMVADPDNPEDVLKIDAEDGQGGDDAMDAGFYLCSAFKEVQHTMPKSYFVAEKMTEAQTQYTDPAILGQIAAMQNARYDQQFGQKVAGVTLPRRGAMLHRQVQ